MGGVIDSYSDSQQDETFGTIPDRYKTIDQVTKALRKAGLESSNLVIGIDYTGSNQIQGKRTFGGKSLHHLDEDMMNPYQRVISVVGRTLAEFDEDDMIPVYGFGDINTRDFGVFKLQPSKGGDCHGFEEVLHVYQQVTPRIELNGPTNFAPIINKAVEVVCESGRTEYHILVIIADGQVDREQDTIRAIVRASYFPISIIMVGVGDGPWDGMIRFDDKIKERRFDNFQFVNFSETVRKAKRNGKDPDVAFSVNSLMEIPDQYKCIRKLQLLGRRVNPKTQRYIK